MKHPKKDVIIKLKKILKENPHGLWVREIARKTGIDKATASRYLSFMEEVEFVFMGRNKIYRLKQKKSEV
ncbi:MAG: helix-turn-helix domain-containing protein [archaeon]|nr:helix-turn-helix domain-containing protein [archaeon]